MEEKQIIKNDGSGINILAIILAVISTPFFIFGFKWMWHDIKDGFFRALIDNLDGTWTILVGFAFIIAAAIIFWAMNACELVVTDKRVYGKATFGKRVDLPFDMISSVGAGWLGRVAVATSSGRITFWLLTNRDEIFSAITNLLIERQSNKTEVKVADNSASTQLRDLKQLLDDGIITQEEFDAKKKELLGI